jgi:hypothetical protein
MNELEQTALKQRFEQAIETFIEKVKGDVNVIAIFVGGSFAYDVLWEKSDIDMMIIVRDQKLINESLCLGEDGLTINVSLIPRSRFKRGLESAVGGSFFQSFMAKGKVVYSTEESFYEYMEDIGVIGEDDQALTALNMAGVLISTLHKAQKWLVARHDLLYAQYFLLKAAETIANMELCLQRIPSSRSAIQKAMELNPEIMQAFYLDPMSHTLSEAEVVEKLERLDRYIEDKIPLFQKPILAYLADQEIKTTAMVARQLRSDGPMIIDVMEYLAEKKVIEKVSQAIKLTPKGRMNIEEIGFLYVP